MYVSDPSIYYFWGEYSESQWTLALLAAAERELSSIPGALGTAEID